MNDTNDNDVLNKWHGIVWREIDKVLSKIPNDKKNSCAFFRH